MFLDSEEMKSQLIVDLCLQPKNKAPIIIDASVLTKTTNDLPSRYINTDNWETVKELQLADPDFNKPAQIDLVIGAGYYEDLMVGNNRLKEPNIPVTYRLSVFAWLIIGRENEQTSNSSSLETYLCHQLKTDCSVFGKSRKCLQLNI